MDDGTATLAEVMAEAASDLLASLDPEQIAKIRMPLAPDSDERFVWYNAPAQRVGLTLAEMDPHQQRLAHRLAGTGLSPAGHATAMQIVAHENIVDRHEQWNLSSPILAHYPGRPWHRRGRDPLLYFFTVFGDPGAAAWSWRMHGHHLNLNYTVVDGEVANLPIFFGVAPAVVPRAGSPAPIRLLGPEEDHGFELVGVLDADQLREAILSPVPPFDVTQVNRAQVEDGAVMDADKVFPPGAFDDDTLRAVLGSFDSYMDSIGWKPEHEQAIAFTTDPKGVPATSFSGVQRAVLGALLRTYIERMPGELADRHLAVVEQDIDELHFAWAGGTEPGDLCYYRVQGPRILVEYVNTQWHGDHAHSLWRDPTNDFGSNLLRDHYADDHHGRPGEPG